MMKSPKSISDWEQSLSEICELSMNYAEVVAGAEIVVNHNAAIENVDGALDFGLSDLEQFQGELDRLVGDFKTSIAMLGIRPVIGERDFDFFVRIASMEPHHLFAAAVGNAAQTSGEPK